MEFFESQEKVLATPAYYRSSVFRCTNRFNKWYGNSSIYLYIIL